MNCSYSSERGPINIAQRVPCCWIVSHEQNAKLVKKQWMVYMYRIYIYIYILQTWIRLSHQWGKRVFLIIFSLNADGIQQAVWWWSAVSGLKATHQFEYLVDESAFSGRKEIKKKKLALRVRHSSSLLALQINAWICVCVCARAQDPQRRLVRCFWLLHLYFNSSPCWREARMPGKKSDGESEAGNHQDKKKKKKTLQK